MKIKRLFINICTCVLGFSPSLLRAQDSIEVDSSYINQHYELRTDFFNQVRKHPGQTVFIGDSLTEGGRWSEITQDKRVVNRGISGDVTYGVLARLDAVLAMQPKKIFLLCGINDMKRGTPHAVIVKNIERMISQVKRQAPKTKLYIQSLLPVNEKMLPASYQKLSNEKIDALNKSIEEVCRRERVRYIDLHPIFEDQAGQLEKTLSIDGLHLWQASYVHWVEYLKKRNLL